MKSHEVLRGAFKPMGAKRIAAELGVSLSLVHKWSRPRPDGRSAELNPLDRVARLVAVTGDVRLVQWLCAAAGGFFVANPPARPLRAQELPRQSCRVLRELAQLQLALAAQWEGGAGPATGLLREEWETLKSDVERWVRLCEGCELNRREPGRQG